MKYLHKFFKMADGPRDIRLEIARIDSELESTNFKIKELLKRQEYLSNRKEILERQLSQEEVLVLPSKNWASDDFEWSKKAESVRKSVFQMNEFRPLQLDCINVTMSNIDCLLIMPTGGGKSLCFQLPALMCDGFTLVISPLVSLMEDQMMALRGYNINACLLNASSTKEHVNNVHKDMITKGSGLKILYVTPEKIAKSKRFMAKLEKAYAAGLLSRIVIDEVHCASQWGHDFRPDYKILGILKRQFPNSCILGLTATATSRVIEDVKNILNLNSDCVLLKASFNRPNLFYEVRKKPANKEAVKEIANIILTQFHGQSGIVYCFSRKDSADVAADLCDRGISAACYHADLSPEARTQVHHAWTKGNLKVIVATVAFGMGIDKPDVRFVIHHTISKSMENYYQESGRAGRDNKQAHCILYYSSTDATRQSCMVFTDQTGLENLYKMLSYCQDIVSCRRSLIGQHFGEEWNNEACHEMCDNCQKKKDETTTLFPERDLTKEAQDVLTILKTAQRISQRVTVIKLLEAWNRKGAKALRIGTIPPPAISADDCQRLIIHLLLEGILREDFHFTPYSTISYLVPGPLANNVLNGKTVVKMSTVNSDVSEKPVTKRKKTKPSQPSVVQSKEKREKESIRISISDDDELEILTDIPSKRIKESLSTEIKE